MKRILSPPPYTHTYKYKHIHMSYKHFIISFVFRFLRNPSELKSIKNISLLRQQMNSSSANNNSPDMVHIKSEPAETADEEMRPTDLSMGQHFRLSNDME